MNRNFFALACLVPLLSVTMACGDGVVTLNIQALEQQIINGVPSGMSQFERHCGNPNMMDRERNTLLTFLIEKCSNNEVIKRLISMGANVNLPDGKGRLPLTVALDNKRSTSILQLLLANGADPDLLDNSGTSVFGQAMMNTKINNSNTFKELDNYRKEHGKNGVLRVEPVNFENLIANGDADEIKSKFEKNRWNINQRNNSGDPLLIIAVKNRRFEVVEALLICGADVNITDFEGKTALHTAVKLGAEDIVRLLLEYNANPEFIDNLGNSAYDYAIDNKNDPQISKLLEEREGISKGTQVMPVNRPQNRQQGNQNLGQLKRSASMPNLQSGRVLQQRPTLQRSQSAPNLYQGNGYYQQQPQLTEKQQQRKQKTQAISGIANALLATFTA